MTPKIQVQGLYKIFGSNPQRALALMADKDLSKEQLLEKYGHTVGLQDVSFQVATGEVFVVMGLSGSGKSTLVRCLNRLIDPTAGKIMVDDDDLTAMDEEGLRQVRQRKFGMVFQRFALLPHRTILDNIAFGLELQDVDTDQRIPKAQEVLGLVGLRGYESSLPAKLSGGMQQRVGLARALAIDPDVLLMDEPFSALDPLIRRDMQNQLIDLQQTMQKTIVFITHDLDEAIKLGNRIAVMKDGVIRQIGTPEDILRQPADDYVAEFVQDVDPSKVLAAEQVMREPDAVIQADAGLRTALRVMRKQEISSVFVVESANRIAGIITVDDVVEAAKGNVTSLRDILRYDFPQVKPETPLHKLIPIAAEARFPIAVVDDAGKLLGIIVRVTVLSALMKEGEEV